MKMLTIRQPWASLIALGVKTLETRSWSTSYRGPLAIHAGKAPMTVRNLGGEFGIDIGRHAHNDTYWGDVALRTGEWYAYRRPNPPGKVDTVWRLPFGAVVAVADLVDVVPIIDGLDNTHTQRFVRVNCPRLANVPYYFAGGPAPTRRDVDDQLPFGDFTPGRYAWLLDNVRAIEPIPAKGHQGLRDVPDDVARIIERSETS